MHPHVHCVEMNRTNYVWHVHGRNHSTMKWSYNRAQCMWDCWNCFPYFTGLRLN